MAASQPKNRDRVRTVSFYAALALVTYLLWVVIRPFVLPLCAAAVLVVFFYPWHIRLERRFGPGPAAFVSTIAVTVLLIVPSLLVIVGFVREAKAAASAVQDAVAQEQLARLAGWWQWLQAHVPIVGGRHLADLAAEVGRNLAGAAASSAADLLRNLGMFVFDAIVVIFAMFFLFRDAQSIMALVRRVLPFEDEHREQVITQARDLVRASVVSSMAVAAAQGAAGGALFWALDLTAPVFWGVMMAFFSLLPIVGAWVIWLPAGVWLMASGQTGKGLLLLGLGLGVVSLIDNVLRPALLAGRSQMNGLLVLISVLGGVGAFGLIGLVVGPVVVATMTSLLTAYTGPARPAPQDSRADPP